MRSERKKQIYLHFSEPRGGKACKAGLKRKAENFFTEYRVQRNAKCRMQNAKCKMQNAKCRIGAAKWQSLVALAEWQRMTIAPDGR